MIILGCVLGCVLMYFTLKPKLTATQEQDNKTKEQNIILQNNKQELESRIIELQKTIGNYQDVVNSTKLEITALQTKEKELENHIQKTRETIDNDNQVIYQKSFDLM